MIRFLLLGAVLLGCFFPAPAEPNRAIEWTASQFMTKVKITRYLPNGSGIEHKYGCVKAKGACNGWARQEDGSLKQTCWINLDDMEDTTWTYRLREFDADGKLVADTVCKPLISRWQCEPRDNP